MLSIVSFKDYRMLGEELGMEKIDIESLTQKGSSPTHRLLLDYKIKVEEFLNILKMIDRLDVASEIEGLSGKLTHSMKD